MDHSGQLEPTQQEVLAVLRSGEVSVKSIAEAIAQYPELAEELIRHVNSAELGLRYSIRKLDHAIALLGQQRVANLVELLHRGDSSHAVGRPKSRIGESVERHP